MSGKSKPDKESKANPRARSSSGGEGMRIAKRIAHAGICSRREAEALIAEGRVQVNGCKLDSPACLVTDRDDIVVDGKPLPEQQKIRVFCFYKPAGCVTTNRDEKGRKTVFDLLPKEMPRVVTIGRLDMNSEGLLLLTTDGELARHLESPQTGWARTYRVRAYGVLDVEALESLEKGCRVDGVQYGPVTVAVEHDASKGAPGKPGNHWLRVTLHEGKNREIRNVLGAKGLKVNRLIRISYGPFQIGNMDKEEIREVRPKALKEMLPPPFNKQIAG